MYKNKNRAIVVAAILLSYAGTVDAYGSLRCKGRFIDVGASATEVLKLCGEPDKRVVTQIPVRAGNINTFTRFNGFATSEEWIYDRGWGKFPAVLHFDAGRIYRIEYLPRR